jgi:hypothetical protein
MYYFALHLNNLSPAPLFIPKSAWKPAPDRVGARKSGLLVGAGEEALPLDFHTHFVLKYLRETDAVSQIEDGA